MASANIQVEIVYANPEDQTIISVSVTPGCSVSDAITTSGILARFPEIDLTTQAVGIFSKRVELTTALRAGDRIEIYRPLLIDPKQRRRNKKAP